jgi:DNA transformation protein
MATSQSTIDFLLDQLAEQGAFSARKMFGEYCLYMSGAPVGLVCDNQLFLRDDAGLRALLHELTLGEPYPGAKPHICITADQWDDRQALGRWVRCAAEARHAAAALKASRPRKVARVRTGAKSVATGLAGLLGLAFSPAIMAIERSRSGLPWFSAGLVIYCLLVLLVLYAHRSNIRKDFFRTDPGTPKE